MLNAAQKRAKGQLIAVFRTAGVEVPKMPIVVTRSGTARLCRRGRSGDFFRVEVRSGYFRAERQLGGRLFRVAASFRRDGDGIRFVKVHSPSATERVEIDALYHFAEGRPRSVTDEAPSILGLQRAVQGDGRFQIHRVAVVKGRGYRKRTAKPLVYAYTGDWMTGGRVKLALRGERLSPLGLGDLLSLDLPPRSGSAFRNLKGPTALEAAASIRFLGKRIAGWTLRALLSGRGLHYAFLLFAGAQMLSIFIPKNENVANFS